MKGRWFVICLASVLFLSVFVDDSTGTLIAPVTLEQLSRKSKLVVTGEVEEVKRYVFDHSDQSYNSVSYVAVIRVNDTIKGKITNERILVERKMTEKKNRFFLFRQWVPFKEGKRVLLFMKSEKSSVYDGNTYYLVDIYGNPEINRTTNTVTREYVYFIEDGERKRLENIPLEDVIEKIKKME